jgi:hypothetical protein
MPVLSLPAYADSDILEPWHAHGGGMLSKPLSIADLNRAFQHSPVRLLVPRQLSAFCSA